MKNVLMLLCAVTLVFGMMGRASAVTIFTDDFNRADNDVVGNNWAEIEAQSDDVAIDGNRAMLRDKPSVMTQPIDLSMRNSLVLMFDWMSNNTEDSDTLTVSYDLTDGNWIPFFSTTLGTTGVWSTENLDLIAQGVYVEHEMLFRLRIETSVSAAGELAYIDNISLTGEISDENYVPASPIPNPEPTTVLLMGIGIVGLIGGVTRKKLNKKTVDNC